LQSSSEEGEREPPLKKKKKEEKKKAVGRPKKPISLEQAYNDVVRAVNTLRNLIQKEMEMNDERKKNNRALITENENQIVENEAKKKETKNLYETALINLQAEGEQLKMDQSFLMDECKVVEKREEELLKIKNAEFN
jgi:HPt (histidine-containing phosphotransfer) domain-containing protein